MLNSGSDGLGNGDKEKGTKEEVETRVSEIRSCVWSTCSVDRVYVGCGAMHVETDVLCTEVVVCCIDFERRTVVLSPLNGDTSMELDGDA